MTINQWILIKIYGFYNFVLRYNLFCVIKYKDWKFATCIKLQKVWEYDTFWMKKRITENVNGRQEMMRKSHKS